MLLFTPFYIFGQTSQGPNSPGTVQGNFLVTNPNNAKVQDNTYANLAGDFLDPSQIYATNFGFTIPTGATINGVVVEVDCCNGAANIAAYLLPVNIGTAQTAITPTTCTSNYTQLGGSDNLWGQTPTADDINSSDWGVSILSYEVSYDIDHIRMTIYYTEVGGGEIKEVAGVTKANVKKIGGKTAATVKKIGGKTF